MTINITKVLAAQEDMAIGLGTTTQTRGGNSVTVTMMGVSFLFDSLADIKGLDTSKYTNVGLVSGADIKLYYYSSGSSATGDDDLVIVPDSGTGRWLQQEHTMSRLTLTSGMDQLLLSRGDDTKILDMSRTDGVADSTGQKLSVVLEDDGSITNGINLNHYSLESGVSTLRNTIGMSDDSLDIFDGNGDNIAQIITNKSNNWGLYTFGALGCVNGLSAIRPNLDYPIIYRSLDASGAIPFNFTGHMVYQGRDNSTAGHYFLAGSSANVRFCIEGGGYIGMGTDNPDRPLHLVESGGSKSSNPTNPDTQVLLDNGGQGHTYLEISGPLPSSGYRQGILFSDDVSGQGQIVYEQNINTLWFSTASSARWKISDVGDLLPWTNNTYDLGSASLQMDDIFSANAVTVSDERIKIDEGSAKNLVPLMKALDPKIFSFKNTIIPATEAVINKRQVTIETVEEQDVIEKIDGKMVKVRKQVKIKKPVTKKEPVYDKDGTLVTYLDKETKERKTKYTDVPVMEEYIAEPAKPEKIISHGRPHTGFMAQQVKAKMDELGINDWAAYAYYEEDDKHTLRLQEFIAPILAYCQELDERLTALEGKK